MKKGVSPLPSVEAALLIANTARGSCRSQSSFRPFKLANARSVSPMTPLARSTLALVFLCTPSRR